MAVRTLVAVGLVLGLGGCLAEGPSPIRVLGAIAFDAECKAKTDVNVTRGALDISSGSGYYTAFNTESELQPIVTSIGGEDIAKADRNDFYVNEVVLTYRSVPAQPFETEVRSYHGVIRPGSSGASSWMSMGLIGPKAYDRLVGSVAAGTQLELFVGVELRGKLSSGQRLSSNQVTFPITVFNSGFAGCPTAGDRQIPSGPCGGPGGQDGTVVGCCSQGATVPAIKTICDKA